MKKVIVLGTKGRFGRAACKAFVDAGWQVTALARRWDEAPCKDLITLTGDAFAAGQLATACLGQNVIVNAVNPLYPNWAEELPKLTTSVINAAKASGACVMIPGNMYNYGADMPVNVLEDTPWNPTTRKGALRVEMENAYRAAGVDTIVLRGGDFIEQTKTGGWFDTYIAASSAEGKSMYPGPLDQVHSWAYLPDMARAMAALADKRADFETFEEFVFEGYNITGTDLIEVIEQTTRTPQKVAGLPWILLRFWGVFSPLMYEVYEMRYLWRVPHAVDGTKLRRVLPDFRATPLPDAMKDALGV